MSLLDTLPHRCTIARVIRMNDSLGGNVYGVEIEQTDVECWEQKASTSESRDYEKRGINVTTKIYFATNPNVTEQHRILVTERNGTATQNLDITDVANPDTLDVVSSDYPDASVGLGILWKVMAKGSSDTQ